LPRPLPSPLREEETSCSTRGAFHRRVTPTRMRGSVPISFAITCVFATTQPSASFHPRFLKCRFRETLSYRRARSPSLPIGPSRAVYAGRRLALLWIRLPPDDFCNLLPTHGHAPEHPIPAVRHAPLSRIAMPNLPSFSTCFTARRPSPLEEGPRELRAATVLPKPARRRCKRAAKQRPRKPSPD